MPGANDKPQLASRTERIACPQCQAPFDVPTVMIGRRVRCPHCAHVWRLEPRRVDRVADALAGAASDVLRIGSTLLAATDHASSLGQLARQAAGPPRPAASEWIGRRLGRYEIRAVLGQGAMGYVYEARDHELQREVAIKLLPRHVEAGREPIGLKLFLQEARAAAGLQHPNIVTIYDVGQADGTYYFAMERVHGATLAELIESRGALPAGQACYVIAAAARALAAGHRAGVIHRDVKPGNIMIDHHGQVKLMDFGLADVAGAGTGTVLKGRPVGTPGWMSPEAARGEAATVASDIYSLGLCLLAAVSGRKWFAHESHEDLLRMQRQARSIRPDELPASLPPRLKQVIVQCLQADPKARYQSADVLAADILRSLAPSPEDDTVILSVGAPRRRHWTWVVVAAGLAAACAAAAWWRWGG